MLEFCWVGLGILHFDRGILIKDKYVFTIYTHVKEMQLLLRIIADV